ncbi:uncharacterized protein LOC132193130 [Neocloeon triangulifer]|uniref:uncharacterized protein LOC132193130 n=1 Tax=Neocloeon triangulifer TaxID=2078957 RepID=UPI00286EDF73|nr:uncharacterized protein LOC132193130 [Neocloeon triangulifer]
MDLRQIISVQFLLLISALADSDNEYVDNGDTNVDSNSYNNETLVLLKINRRINIERTCNNRLEQQRAQNPSWGIGNGGWSTQLFFTITPPVFFSRTFTPTVFIPTTPGLYIPLSTIFIKTKKPKTKKTTTPKPVKGKTTTEATTKSEDTTSEETTSVTSEETTTVEAATPGPCTQINCPSYNCTKDNGKSIPPLFSNNGTQFLAAPSPNGQLRITCGQLWLFSTNLKNYTDAASTCCSMSMTLATLKNSTEINCLSEMAKYDQFFTDQPRLFWTSGASFSCNYSWCPSNETISPNTNIWMSGFPKSSFATPPNQDCVRALIDKGKLSLNTDYCSALNYYICKGPVSLIENQALVSSWPTTPAASTTPIATTTTVAPCVTQKCPEAMCKRDTNSSVFINNAGQFLTVPAANGQLKISCGRLYLFSTNVKSLPDAISTCCSMGMTLATFGDVAKQNCVNDLANFDPDFAVSRQLWTSGATSFCSLRWCTTNINVSNVNWMANYPKPVAPAPPDQDCLRLVLGKGVSLYNTDSCNNVNNYACEGDISLLQSTGQVTNWPTTGPTITTVPPCPVVCPSFQCAKNPAYFIANNSVINVAPNFGILKETCGKLYLFSRASVSQTEASVACCEIGMSLLSLDNKAEQDCLHNLNNVDMMYSPRAFWTSGSQRGCPLKSFKWCSTNESWDPGTLQWAPGQPNYANGVQDCIQLTMNPGATTNTVLNDESCFTPFNFICKGSPSLLGTGTTTAAPLTCNASCQYMSCEKDPSLYTPDGRYLSVKNETGIVKAVCGRSIIYGNELKSYQDAMRFCCQAQMKLLSFETFDKWSCFSSEMIGRKFWVSATTRNCPRNYRWCLENQMSYVGVNDSFWRPGQPQDGGILECTQVNLTITAQNFLNDESCISMAYAACEGSPTLLSWYVTTTPAPTQDPNNCSPVCPALVCERNPTNYTRDGKFINDTTMSGFFKETCGKLYFFSSYQASHFEAYKACCDLGLRLVSVEDQFMHQCLVDLNNAQTKYTDKVFWTSGSDKGCPFKFKWCSTGSWFSNVTVNWLPGQPNDAYGVQDCVQLTLSVGSWMNSAYNDDPCSFTYSFICEGDRALYKDSSFYQTTSTSTTTTASPATITTPYSPFNCDTICPSFTCERDPFIFSSDGRYLNASRISGEVRETCGKLYYFSQTQETYADAASTCCDMGMSLLSVESNAEHQCLVNTNTFNTRYVNKIFWTSGSQRGCPFNFQWCTAPVKMSFTSTSIAWLPGQPNNLNGVQDCVQLTLNAVNISSNGYNDEPCAYANYYICEGDTNLLWKATTVSTSTTTSAPTTLTTTPVCNAVCPQTNCDKDAKMFTPDGKYLSDYVTTSNTVGILAETCGRIYYFGTKLVSSSEANAICCSMGMTAVAVETFDENKCIAEVYGTLGLPTRIYWTSASQKGCNLSFKWCSSNITFGRTSINWLQGQPNNLYGVQDCVQMSLTQGTSASATFNDDPCSYSYYYTCEGSPALLWKNSNTTTTTTVAPCVASCPQVNCDRDFRVFTSDGKYLNEQALSASGVLSQSCGKLYFYGNRMVSASDANYYCCTMGMTSVAVETGEENKCIATSYSQTGLPSRFYWTSASQKGCNLYFKWCSSNITFGPTSINWLQGQPNNLNGVQDCVQMTLAASNTPLASFNDDPCTYAYYYLCEGSLSLLQRSENLEQSTTPSTQSNCAATCPSVFCEKDPSLYTSDGKFLAVPSPIGVVKEACGKVYLFSYIQVTQSDAATICCEAGMNLVSIETFAEHECLTQLNNVDMRYSSKMHWTSGNQKGCPFNFRWCPSNNTFSNSSINWLAGQPNNLNGIQDCVQLLLTTGVWTASAFIDEACTYSNYFICEADRTVLQSYASTTPQPTLVTTTANPAMVTSCLPSCPSFICDRDPTFFTADGQFLAVPPGIGSVQEICGNLYFFSTNQLSYANAGAACCDLGMSLVSVESWNEHMCLTDLNNANMKINGRSYWTSGSQQSCPFNFKWCTSPNNTFFYNSSINWLAGQPNNAFNAQGCVQMTLATGPATSTTYDDQPCSFVNYFICEGSRLLLQANANRTTVSPTTTTASPSTSCLPKCPSYACNRNPTYFTPDGLFLNVQSSTGILRDTCGKVYFFGNNFLDYTTAASTCCEMGMVLLSVETSTEHQCLSNLNNVDMLWSRRNFWTAGSDLNCPFNFKWCTSPNNNSYFQNTTINWATGQPNNAFGQQYCVQLSLATGFATASTYDDQPCNFLTYFACEGDLTLLQKYGQNLTTTTIAPTTTCKPKCPSYQCERDPSLFTTDGRFLNVPTEFGILRQSCGRLYFFSKIQDSFVNSAASCCDLGMSLLSVETQYEHQCLTDLNNQDMKFSNKYHWTAGSDTGCPFNFFWCTTNVAVPSINWMAGQPNNAFGLQDCIQLALTTGTALTSTYDDQPCTFANYFICEGDPILLSNTSLITTTTQPPTTVCLPSCPTYICDRDPTYFTADGRFLNLPSNVGFVRETCGKLYLFSTIQLNYADAAAACCDAGMTLLSVETAAEHDCLVNLNNADMRYSNRIFWTSGSDQACPFNFKWCTSTSFFSNNSINWQLGQPNNGRGLQDCVQVTLNTGSSALTNYNDEYCSFVSYFMCEGDRLLLQSNAPSTTPQPTTTTTTVPTTICTPKCPAYTCERDPSLFSADGKSLVIPSSYGFLKETCGRLYFIGITQEIYADALSYCCDYGMTLLSVESSAEHQCLSDLNNGDASMKYSNRIFWTSGSDQNCAFNFRWCSTGGFFGNSSLNWASGQPNNGRGIQDCVQLTLNTGVATNSVYNDESCSFVSYYICEGDRALLTNANSVTSITSTTTTTSTTTRPCTSPVCASNFVCDKDPTLFTSDGRYLNVPISVGYLKEICGKLYMFSTTQATFLNALSLCCDVSMELLSVESTIEHTCITDINNNELRFNNRAHWTSGTDAGCPMRFQWCTGARQTFTNTSITWGFGQPDNQFGIEECVQWNLNTGAWTTSTFSDVPCNNFYYYICEGDPALLLKNAVTTTSTSTTTAPTTTTACQSPLCSIPSCNIDTNYVNADGSLKPIPSSIGYVKYACGRRYFFSTLQRIKTDAALICCVLGMKLVSIETNAELTCLSNLNKADANLNSSQFYLTSGTDENCPYKYTWCGTNTKFSDTAWYTGQPDKYLPPENCIIVALNIDTATQRGYSGLLDTSCNTNFNFICE